MTRALRISLIAAFAASFGMVSLTSAAPILIQDDFEVDSSANYTVVNDNDLVPPGVVGPDGTIDFQFDYIGAGIPLAPNSTAGDTKGLRMTANDTDNGSGSSEEDHITAFHNTLIAGTPYKLHVDMYMNVTIGSSGTTEHAHIGVAGDGATPNSIFTPISGTGHFLAMTGEGGSSSDFRHFVEPNPVNSGDLSYLTPEHTTNATGALYQAIFPGGDFPGSPGNRWTTLTINISAGGQITYALDGTPIIRDTAVVTDGYVSLGYADLFDSVASPFQAQFVVYDNLLVVPEPATLGLLVLGGLTLIRRRR